MERARDTDVTDFAGATPLVRASRLAPGGRCYLKLELRNPTGSWWDRVAARATASVGTGARATLRCAPASAVIAFQCAARARGFSLAAALDGEPTLEEKRTVALFGLEPAALDAVDLGSAGLSDAYADLAAEIREALGGAPDVLVVPARTDFAAVARALGCRCVVAPTGTWADVRSLARSEGLLAHPDAASAAQFAATQPGVSVAILHETGERSLSAGEGRS